MWTLNVMAWPCQRLVCILDHRVEQQLCKRFKELFNMKQTKRDIKTISFIVCNACDDCCQTRTERYYL